MNDAIDKLKYYKPDDIFVIPLLIDNSTVPTFISSKIQYIDYKREDGWELLEKSLALAATQQKLKSQKEQPMEILSSQVLRLRKNTITYQGTR